MYIDGVTNGMAYLFRKIIRKTRVMLYLWSNLIFVPINHPVLEVIHVIEEVLKYRMFILTHDEEPLYPFGALEHVYVFKKDASVVEILRQNLTSPMYFKTCGLFSTLRKGNAEMNLPSFNTIDELKLKLALFHRGEVDKNILT